MTTRRLKTVTRTQGNNEALKDGTVAPAGYALDFEEVDPLVAAFRRMVRGIEFDVCEMAFTTYLCAKAHGAPFTALPVFLVRGFHHQAIVRGVDSPVRVPADLEGRRVGVNRGYTVTTGVWARGILHREYGVDLDRITWAPSGDEHVAAYRPPANVVPLEGDDAVADRVVSGELPAAVGITADRPGLEPLIADPDEAAFAALERTGLYPINHLVVVRDELLSTHPDLAPAVFAAFAESKQRYLERLWTGGLAEARPSDRLHQRVAQVLEDPLPYGLAPNAAVIDTLIDHAVHQRILDERPAVEALFADGTHDLTA